MGLKCSTDKCKGRAKFVFDGKRYCFKCLNKLKLARVATTVTVSIPNNIEDVQSITIDNEPVIVDKPKRRYRKKPEGALV